MCMLFVLTVLTYIALNALEILMPIARFDLHIDSVNKQDTILNTQ